MARIAMQVAEDDMRDNPPFAADEVLRVLAARYSAHNPAVAVPQLIEDARLTPLETDLALLELEEQGDARIHATGGYLRRDQARKAEQQERVA
jgi:hypothetical protein